MLRKNKVKEIIPAIDHSDPFPKARKAMNKGKPSDTGFNTTNVKAKALRTVESLSNLALRSQASLSNLASLSPEKNAAKSPRFKTPGPSSPEASMPSSRKEATRSADSRPSTPDPTTPSRKRSLARSLRSKASKLELRSKASNSGIGSVFPLGPSSRSPRSQYSTPNLRSKDTSPALTRQRTLSNATSGVQNRSVRKKISVPNILATVTDPGHPSNFKNVCLSKKSPNLASVRRQRDIDNAVWHFTADELEEIHVATFSVFETHLRLLALLEIKNNIQRVEADRRDNYKDALETYHADRLVQKYNMKCEGVALHQKAIRKAHEEFDLFKESASERYLASLALQDNDDIRMLLLSIYIDFFGRSADGSLRDVLLYYEQATGDDESPEDREASHDKETLEIQKSLEISQASGDKGRAIGEAM